MVPKTIHPFPKIIKWNHVQKIMHEIEKLKRKAIHQNK